jgi:lysophospholipase L1-like esterase
MVNQMRRRYEAQILSRPSGTYTHLIVFGGVNDLYSDLTAGRSVAKISADLAYIYDSARARGMKVVAITVAPWGGFKRYYNDSRARTTRELNAWIGSRVAEGSVDFVVDAYALLSCGDAERLCDDYELRHKDGLHFNQAGHEKLGAAIYATAFSDCL